MPPKRKHEELNNRWVAAKKRSHSRTRVRGATVMVNRGPTLVASTFHTKLRYHESDHYAASGGPVLKEFVFRLNSIFDPDLTAVGHQPLGRDQIVTLYSRYRVMKAYWTVVCVPDSTTTVGAFSVCPTNDSTLIGVYNTTCEHPRGKNTWSTAHAPGVIKGGVSMPDLNGQTVAQYKADDRFQAQVGSNPSEDLALHITYINGNTVNAYDAFSYHVDITYEVDFFDPITPGGS